VTPRRTKIVATVGPATDEPTVMRAVIEAGVDVVRHNLSHANRQEHARRLALARQCAQEAGRHVGIMVDTRGPEVRLGRLASDSVELEAGAAFTLVCDGSVERGDDRRCAVNHAGLGEDVRVGDRVLLDDGRLVLEVTLAEARSVRTSVVCGGTLLPGKKVQVPGRSLNLPTLSDADAADLAWAALEGVEWVAASFIKDARSVLSVRRVIESAHGETLVMAKIETPEGLENLDTILAASDGVMVARGDLGVELPVEEVPPAQKRIIAAARRLGKPVVTATEMLESMVHAPRPTRAEASDVANAVWDGSDAVMLSAETATGDHPVEAVTFMDRICRKTEGAADFSAYLRAAQPTSATNATEAVSRATVQVATDLRADAIITATEGGFTARMVARHRPQVPIVAVTPSPRVARVLAVVWGVASVVATQRPDRTPWEAAVESAAAAGLVRQGGLAIVTGGEASGATGATDLLQGRTVAPRLVAGRGIGRIQVVGRVHHLDAHGALPTAEEGMVLVARSGDVPGFVHALEASVAVVVEEAGLTSTAAVAALSLRKPAVVGAQGALERLDDGAWVTVDALRGWVFEGRVRLADEPVD
jgi:pyruvate kinase